MKRTFILISTLIISIIIYGQSAKPEISIDVNGFKSIEIQPAYPVIINISILNSEYSNYEFHIDQLPDTIRESPGFRKFLDSINNSSFLKDSIPNWHNKIILAVESTGKAKDLLLRRELLRPYPDQYFSLTPGTAKMVYYGVDPSETKKWKQGDFKIIAGFPLPPGNDTIWSEAAVIKMRKGALTRLSDYSDEQLRFTATYWIRREQCDQAAKYAEELMRRNPDSFMNTMVMAEMNICLNNNESAMQYLRRSLDLFEEQADPDLFPPAYIHRLLNEVQMKLMIRIEDRD